MNIINLRSVGNFEIPDSYMGILRISPNIVVSDNVEITEDDPSELLIEGNNEVILSDSGGNELPFTFKSKLHKITLSDKTVINDFISVSHNYKKLYIVNGLNVRSTIFIDRKNNIDDIKNQSPLIFVKEDNQFINAIGYPVEAPDDARYINRNNIHNLDRTQNIDDELIKKLSPNHPIFTEENSEHVKVAGQVIYRNADYNNEVYKVPEINKRTYALGICPGHTYPVKENDSNVHDLTHIISNKPTGNYTQLSYVNLESLIWKSLESSSTGLERSYKGRYFNLNPVGTDETSAHALGKELFGTDDIDSDLIQSIFAKAPITGIGVQTGTIHYNAIPARHYFFHLARHYKSQDRNISVTKLNGSKGLSGAAGVNKMNNLMTEYALCDGKTLYDSTTKTSDYPNIDAASFGLNFNLPIYKAISVSMGNGGSALKTPPLFELDQLSLRYLRGLNWKRTAGKFNSETESIDTESYDTKDDVLTAAGWNLDRKPENDEYIKFIDNTTPYKHSATADDADISNHAKNINKVGMHYANYDNISSNRYKHVHMLFTKSQNEHITATFENTIDENVKFIQDGVNQNEIPPNWDTYTQSPSNNETFYGTYIMRTAGNILNEKGSINIGDYTPEASLKILQDWPISVSGGSDKYFYTLVSCYRFGKRHIGKCMNHRTRCGSHMHVRNSRYQFATALPEQKWRFTTSLP